MDFIQTAELIPYVRPNGQKYFCFSQVRAQLSDSVPPGTLKTWCRFLNIDKEKCSVEEHDFFKTALPNIAIGAFKLISECDTLKLFAHYHNRHVSSTPLKQPRLNANASLPLEDSRHVTDTCDSFELVSRLPSVCEKPSLDVNTSDKSVQNSPQFEAIVTKDGDQSHINRNASRERTDFSHPIALPNSFDTKRHQLTSTTCKPPETATSDFPLTYYSNRLGDSYPSKKLCSSSIEKPTSYESTIETAVNSSDHLEDMLTKHDEQTRINRNASRECQNVSSHVVPTNRGCSIILSEPPETATSRFPFTPCHIRQEVSASPKNLCSSSILMPSSDANIIETKVNGPHLEDTVQHTHMNRNVPRECNNATTRVVARKEFSTHPRPLETATSVFRSDLRTSKDTCNGVIDSTAACELVRKSKCDNTLPASNVFLSDSDKSHADPTVILDDDDNGDEVHVQFPRKFKFNHRSSRLICFSELSDDAGSSLENLKAFYSKPLNPKRFGHALQPSSVEKMVERVRSLFKFLKDSRGLNPSLDYVEDAVLVEDFCNFLKSKERNLKSSTVSRHICAFINVIRFLKQDLSSKEQEALPSLSRLRALQRQLEFDAKREKRGNSDTRSNSILFEEILQAIRQLKEQFEDARSSVSKARILMNFSLLLLYTTTSPGRATEFVTLRLTDSENETFEQGNFLVVRPESMTLICKEYKTSKVYGIDRTELTSADLMYYLRLYIQRFRSKLLQGNTHDFAFVNHHGLPFTIPGFRNYLGSLFEQLCGVRLSINNLRKILVTFFLSLPESNDNQLSESVARIMKHSQRTQKLVYDSRHQSVVKAPAMRFLARKAREGIFQEENPTSSEMRASKGEAKPLPDFFVLMDEFLSDEPCGELYLDFDRVALKMTCPNGDVYGALVSGSRCRKISSFYDVYCRYHTELKACSLCGRHHNWSILCLPAYFDPEAVAFLANAINGNVDLYPTTIDGIAVMRLVGYLMIKEDWLESKLPYFRCQFHLKTLSRYCAYVFELYRNGYSELVCREPTILWRLVRQHNSLKSFYRHCRRIQRRDRRYVRSVWQNSPWSIAERPHHEHGLEAYT